MKSLLNKFLDKSIFFSFDAFGFNRHQKNFNTDDLSVDLNGKLCIITGANSGLGFEASRGLAGLGAKVILVCRNKEKGLKALQKIQSEFKEAQLELQVMDVSDLSAIRRFVDQWGDTAVDILIHNAGILPHERKETPDGIEMTLATHLIGPFLMTQLLLPHLKKSTQARVIFVSSGGMYLQKLDLKNFQSVKKPFNGVKTYANTKRAEVILTELFARQNLRSITFNSMHPGWANTPGVEKSLPLFWKITKSHLRKSRQGADTIIWLAACPRIKGETGKFWFDRMAVSPNVFRWTQESPEDRKQLWKLCCELSGTEVH